MSQVNLMKALQRLHRLSGEPSARELARRTHGALSHTTVSQTLRGRQLPSWRSLEFVVSALQGDLDEFRSLWIAARDAEEAPRKPVADMTGASPRFLMADGDMLPAVASAVNKSRLLQQNNGREEAITFLEQWQSGQRISSAVVYEMARLVGTKEIDSGRYRDLITEAMEDDVPETMESALWLARQCKARGDESRQFFFLMNALRIAPQSARVLYEIGDYYEGRLDLDNAARFFLRAFGVERDLTHLYPLVNVLCMLDRAPEAARICQEIYLDESDSEVVDQWAKSLVAMGEHDEAVRILREHVKREPKDRGFTLVELGRILCRVGRFDEASKTYQEILESEPSPYMRKYAMAGLAYISLAQGNESEAASVLDQVVAEDLNG